MKEDHWMDLYVTMVIALGGIATGVAAIWTAVLAGRQARDQRTFFEEQSERERRRLEAELMHGMWTKWTSSAYLDFRRGGMEYVRDHYVKDGKLLEVDYLDGATRELFNFLNEIGYLTRAGILRLERVFATYGGAVRLGWALWESAILKERKHWPGPHYADFEYLYHQVLAFAEKNGPRVWGRAPSADELVHFVYAEEIRAVEALSASSQPRNNDDDGDHPTSSSLRPE
jgi:hypothetical protein